VVETVVKSADGPTNFWFDLDTRQPAMDTNHSDDDAEARQWQIKTGVDVGAILNGSNSGLGGVDMAALRVADSEWVTATPASVMAAMMASKPEAHTAVLMESNLPSTFLFKTRENGVGILQIIGPTDNPRGVKIQYKLVQTDQAEAEPGAISDGAKSDAQKRAHANLQARMDAASGIREFTERDSALASLAADAAVAGDVEIVKTSLAAITEFTARDDARENATRELLKAGRYDDAFGVARSITEFTRRDEALGDVARKSAAAGKASVVKDALKKMTEFTVRDDAAYESARLLVKAGLRPDALEVARSITEFTRRDEALGELAK